MALPSSNLSQNILPMDWDEEYSSDIFSKLRYEDLKKAHEESVVPVTDDDFKQNYNSMEDIRIKRHQQTLIPLNETSAKDYLDTDKKREVIDKYKTSEMDTGSPNVQVALLTQKIESLTNHFKAHKKDNHSRRGLLMMVNKRRKLLDYLKSKDFSSYKQLISDLGLRK